MIIGILLLVFALCTGIALGWWLAKVDQRGEPDDEIVGDHPHLPDPLREKLPAPSSWPGQQHGDRLRRMARARKKREADEIRRETDEQVIARYRGRRMLDAAEAFNRAPPPAPKKR